MLRRICNIFRKSSPSKELPIITKGDFIRTDWFNVEQTAEVFQVNGDQERFYISILPLMINDKKYDPKLTGIHFYYLMPFTRWVKKDRIKRLATAAEIKIVKQEYFS